MPAAAPRSRRRDRIAGKPSLSHGALTARPVYLLSKISSNATPPRGLARHSRRPPRASTIARPRKGPARSLSVRHAARRPAHERSGQPSQIATVEAGPASSTRIITSPSPANGAMPMVSGDARPPSSSLQCIEAQAGSPRRGWRGAASPCFSRASASARSPHRRRPASGSGQCPPSAACRDRTRQPRPAPDGHRRRRACDAPSPAAIPRY